MMDLFFVGIKVEAVGLKIEEKLEKLNIGKGKILKKVIKLLYYQSAQC